MADNFLSYQFKLFKVNGTKYIKICLGLFRYAIWKTRCRLNLSGFVADWMLLLDRYRHKVYSVYVS